MVHNDAENFSLITFLLFFVNGWCCVCFSRTFFTMLFNLFVECFVRSFLKFMTIAAYLFLLAVIYL